MLKKIKKHTLAYTIGLLLMVGAVGLLTGCGEQPTGPSVGVDDPVVIHNTGKGQDLRATNDGGVVQSGLIGGLVTVVEKTVSGVVGVAGGTLSTTLTSGQTKLIIPSGALDEAVRIDMYVKQTKPGERYYTEYEFGPHGLVFNTPSTLGLSLPYADGTVVSLRWFNPQTNEWEWQASKSVRNGKVEFSVYHFSKYGIS